MLSQTSLWMALLGCTLPAGALAEAMGCLVEPDRVADVGSQSVGVIERLLVERGDTVASGQVVARLSAQVERASVSVAEARSQTEAELRQAMAAHDLAQRKLERVRDLLKRDFVSDQAVDQAEAEALVAEQRVAQARDSQRVALKEYRLSAAQLSQRDVKSPFEGIVVERYRTEGERIEREPVVRVARIDPLRVEAIVPAAQFGSIVAGQMATIKTDLPSFSALTAKVVLVDRVIDPASNSFRVRLSMPNPDRKIPAGLRCRVDFASAAAPKAQAAGTSIVPSQQQLQPPGKSAQPKVATQTMLATHGQPASPMGQTTAGQAGAMMRSTQTQMRAEVVRAGLVPVHARTTALPSYRVVTQRTAPERMLVKQYMASREPRLSMSQRMALPQKASLDDDRPLFSLR